MKNRKHQIGSGERKIYGILFDGAWLWEEYVNTIIGSAFHHPMNKIRSGKQHLFIHDDSKHGLIYPDFISKNKDKRIIADAKYKPIDNIGNRDYLQVLAYMFRFDAKNGYYIYPMEVDAEDDVRFILSMNQGSTYENDVKERKDVTVIKYGFKIPAESSDYKTFKTQMEKIEGNLSKEFSISNS